MLRPSPRCLRCASPFQRMITHSFALPNTRHARRLQASCFSTTSDEPPIIIIGAGLAGLALGQGLKQANRPFRIFERDESAAFRAQGYRIRISPDGASSLKRLLPGHLFELFEASCGHVVPGGQQLNALTAESTHWGQVAPGAFKKADAREASASGGGIGKHNGGLPALGRQYNADRAILRSVLMRSLEPYITFGKAFSHFSLHNDSARTVAHFADGSLAEGRFLVGADGVRSRVRKQLLPGFPLLDTEGRAIYGKTTITSDVLTRAVPLDGFTLAGEYADSTTKLFIDTMQFQRQITFPSASDPTNLHLPSDYIYWVLTFRNDNLEPEADAGLHRLSSQEAAGLSITLTSHWHSRLREILLAQDTGSSSALTLHSANPATLASREAWNARRLPSTANRITIIGDAAHPMPPVGGVGANTAFQDAADLSAALTSRSTLNEANVQAFEEGMRVRAHAAVERSAGGGKRFFGMRDVGLLKPVEW